MPWFKVDDGLADHPKTVLAGNAAMGLWVRSGAWSAKHLTEGLIPAHMIPVLGNRAQAKALVAAGLWVSVGADYRFHQWDEDGRQPSRESVLAEREANRVRQQKARDRARESRVSHAVTHTPVTPGVTVPPSRPVPTRPTDMTYDYESGHLRDGPEIDFDSNQIGGQRAKNVGITDIASVRLALTAAAEQPVSVHGAVLLTEAILSKARHEVRDVDAYVATVCRNSAPEVQQAYFDLDIEAVA